MDGRLPSINCFFKKKDEGYDEEEESMTEIMNLSDYGFLTNNFNSNQPCQGDDNSYISSPQNNTYVVNQSNAHTYQNGGVFQGSVERLEYSYQGYGDVYTNNNNRNGTVCQELNLYQDIDGNWIKSLTSNNWSNRNQNDFGPQNIQGTTHNLVRNHDTAESSFSSFDQINAYDINDAPSPYHSDCIIGGKNDNGSSSLSSKTSFDNNRQSRQGQAGVLSSSKTGLSDKHFEGYNIERSEDSEMTICDISYRNGDLETCVNTEGEIEYFSRDSNPEGVYPQLNLEYFPREDHELAQMFPSEYGVDKNITMCMNDNNNDLQSENFSHQNQINKGIHFCYGKPDHQTQENINNSSYVSGHTKITPGPFHLYKENARENIDTDRMIRVNNGIPTNSRQSLKSQAPVSAQQITGRDFMFQENGVPHSKRFIDTGQMCNDDNINNNNGRCHYTNGSNHQGTQSAPAGEDTNILPTFSSLLERKDRDSPMSSSSSSSTSSSNDGSCVELLDDLVRDLLNSKGKRKDSTYIALISRAIFSSPEKKMLLSEIYDYLSKIYKLDTLNSQAWRNSVRHNLSLNECFVKHKRLGRGRGHYWSIHPACVEDFAKGDFRRRQARRLAQRNTKGGSAGNSGNGNQKTEAIDTVRARQSS